MEPSLLNQSCTRARKSGWISYCTSTCAVCSFVSRKVQCRHMLLYGAPSTPELIVASATCSKRCPCGIAADTRLVFVFRRRRNGTGTGFIWNVHVHSSTNVIRGSNRCETNSGWTRLKLYWLSMLKRNFTPSKCSPMTAHTWILKHTLAMLGTRSVHIQFSGLCMLVMIMYTD
jgi:hypothetical protein